MDKCILQVRIDTCIVNLQQIDDNIHYSYIKVKAHLTKKFEIPNRASQQQAHIILFRVTWSLRGGSTLRVGSRVTNSWR